MKVPKVYYSVYFEEPDVNDRNEIRVLEHNNDPGISREMIEEMPNHFTTRKKAEKAAQLVWEALSI